MGHYYVLSTQTKVTERSRSARRTYLLVETYYRGEATASWYISPKFTNIHLRPILVWGGVGVRVRLRGPRFIPGWWGGRGLSLGGGGGGSGDGVSDDRTVFDLKLDPRAYTEGAGEELLGE